VRVRHHHRRHAAFQTELEAGEEPALTFPAKYEYRVGVPQPTELGAHIHRQPADKGRSQQQTDRYTTHRRMPGQHQELPPDIVRH
jgi:hypothetical protein